MAKRKVLIVEDNPRLRLHLALLLSEHGFECVESSNEADARIVLGLHLAIGAIIADIDLSETGGDSNGGILLAESLVETSPKIPIVLISQTPQFSPGSAVETADERRHRLGIHAVLDRTDERFREELVAKLNEIFEGRATNAR
jgi:DNA-binding NtrC family response regulator